MCVCLCVCVCVCVFVCVCVSVCLCVCAVFAGPGVPALPPGHPQGHQIRQYPAGDGRAGQAE